MDDEITSIIITLIIIMDKMRSTHAIVTFTPTIVFSHLPLLLLPFFPLKIMHFL